MASKTYSDSDLNDYFEAMSFQDDEEKTWQEYTDFLVTKIADLVCAFKFLAIPIDIRATGSSVEKLKIITPGNIGDIDIMVWSLAEETKITESIMEYSIPDNPAFVRLRGKDHPILQHCLAENSDYVASITLKDFHPKVFGQTANLFHLIPKMFQKLQDIPSYEMVCEVQSNSGPSIQCNVSQTRGSLRDHVTGMKGYSEFKTNDEVSGFLEWMSIAMNPGKRFTDDHSALVDEASKYFEETVQRMGEDASIENFGYVLSEVMTGPRTQALRTKFQELETKAGEKEKEESKETQESLKQRMEQEKTGQGLETGEVEGGANHLKPYGLEGKEEREKDLETGEPEASATQAKPEERDAKREKGMEQIPETGEPEASASQIKPEGRDENEETQRKQHDLETGKPEASATKVKPDGRDEKGDTERDQDPETGTPEANASQIETKGFESDYNESNARRSDDTQEHLHHKDSPNISYEQANEQHSGSRLQDRVDTVKAADPTIPTVEGEETDMKKMTEENVRQYCVESFLRIAGPSKSQEQLQKEYLEIASDQTRQKGGMDIVPAFLAKGWPAVARDWISRDRLWPNQNVISSILDYGFHLVAKTPNESDRPDLDFRLSFSHAELVLSKELNDVQRQCYRCLKLYHLTIIGNRKPKTFASYFLKTILFWAIEETGMEFWNSENRGTCVMMLLRKLLQALETKFLAHFFIPEFNLLGDVAKEFPEELSFLADEVRKVCEDPMSYPNASVEEEQGATANATVEIGPCNMKTAISGQLVDPNMPSKEDTSTNNQDSSPLAIRKAPDSTTSTSSPFFTRFKEYQSLYRQVYQEMLDLALSDEEAVDTNNPIISSIVTNLRKVMAKMETDPRREMERVLEHGLENTYTSYLFHTGPTPRDRILSMLKGQAEMFAYVVRQEDLFPGNEHVIVNRMLNSSSDGSSDPFDMSVLYPEGGSVLANINAVLAAQFEPKKQSHEAIDDDIPLD